MQAGAKGVGCYKCGKPGHWSRDCTVPPSEWINRQAQPGQNSSQANQNGDGVAPEVAPLGLPAKKKRAVKPKLTFDTLQRPQDGLPVVFLTFANRFRKKFKGRGHEGSDLVRLLEMYERWQHNLFPSLGFDDFVAGVEKIGRSSEVKKELRELRIGAIRLLEEEDQPEPAIVPDQGAADEGREVEDDAVPPAERDFGATGPAADDEDYMLDAGFEEEMFVSAREADHNEDLEGVMDDDLMDELMEDPGNSAKKQQPQSVAQPQAKLNLQERLADEDLHEGAEQRPRRLPSASNSANSEQEKSSEMDATVSMANEAVTSFPNVEDQEDPASVPRVAPSKRQRIDSDSDSE